MSDFDTDYSTDYTTVSDAAYDVSTSWSDAANDAYVANDIPAYNAYDTQADAFESYSNNMEYVAADPTDASAWSASYSDASSASWDAWSAATDAYIDGDYALADQLTQQSYAAESTANSTWSAWSAASAAPAYSPMDYTASGGSGDASMISNGDITSVL